MEPQLGNSAGFFLCYGYAPACIDPSTGLVRPMLGQPTTAGTQLIFAPPGTTLAQALQLQPAVPTPATPIQTAATTPKLSMATRTHTTTQDVATETAACTQVPPIALSPKQPTSILRRSSYGEQTGERRQLQRHIEIEASEEEGGERETTDTDARVQQLQQDILKWYHDKVTECNGNPEMLARLNVEAFKVIRKANGEDVETNLFFSFFKTLVGKEVVVELKNDLSISGTLHSVDSYMNMKLLDISLSVADQERFPHMIGVKHIFIRATIVRYVHLTPEHVDTQLLQDATRKVISVKRKKIL